MTENEVLRVIKNVIEYQKALAHFFNENYAESENEFDWLLTDFKPEDYILYFCINKGNSRELTDEDMEKAKKISKLLGLSDNTKIEDLKVKHEAFEIN